MESGSLSRMDKATSLMIKISQFTANSRIWYRVGLVLFGLAWVFLSSTLCGCGAMNGHLMNRSGKRYFDKGNYEFARYEFERALMDDPYNANYAYNVARTMELDGEYGDAEGMYQHALTLNPNHLPSYHALGGMLRQQGRVDEARELLVAWSETQPYSAEAQFSAAHLYHQEGNFPAAQRAYQQGLRDLPPSPQQQMLANPYHPDAQAILFGSPTMPSRRFPYHTAPSLQMSNTMPVNDPSMWGGPVVPHRSLSSNQMMPSMHPGGQEWMPMQQPTPVPQQQQFMPPVLPGSTPQGMPTLPAPTSYHGPQARPLRDFLSQIFQPQPGYGTPQGYGQQAGYPVAQGVAAYTGPGYASHGVQETAMQTAWEMNGIPDTHSAAYASSAELPTSYSMHPYAPGHPSGMPMPTQQFAGTSGHQSVYNGNPPVEYMSQHGEMPTHPGYPGAFSMQSQMSTPGMYSSGMVAPSAVSGMPAPGQPTYHDVMSQPQHFQQFPPQQTVQGGPFQNISSSTVVPAVQAF